MLLGQMIAVETLHGRLTRRCFLAVRGGESDESDDGEWFCALI
jgi:hypothetical protein